MHKHNVVITSLHSVFTTAFSELKDYSYYGPKHSESESPIHKLNFCHRLYRSTDNKKEALLVFFFCTKEFHSWAIHSGIQNSYLGQPTPK